MALNKYDRAKVLREIKRNEKIIAECRDKYPMAIDLAFLARHLAKAETENRRLNEMLKD